MSELFPYFTKGTIIKGFGRGAKELGFPTANFSEEVTSQLPSELKCGIYYGWSKVDNRDVYPMVMSIGFNPFYNNNTKSMETHIMHKFNKDLYGCVLSVVIVGWIRDEKNFTSAEGLTDEIRNDIKVASGLLEQPKMQKLKNHEYFRDN